MFIDRNANCVIEKISRFHGFNLEPSAGDGRAGEAGRGKSQPGNFFSEVPIR